jgi:GTPase SAR1 family protein
MRQNIMQQAFARFKSDVAQLFTDLHELAVQLGDPQYREAAARLIANVNQPFLFVVVGEVKSGKSSFINALLGEEICAVAPDPCTDVIQKITHAEAREERRISEFLREVGLPVEALREVAIVDTPGTNSIIERHQVITERFIPESDLVIFIFPALNPYVKSAWDFFELVHTTWHKKIVFVMQQADRASAQELEVNLRRVAELARERGINDPLVFPVSAKLALEGRIQDSGLDALWEHIRATVTGGRHYALKMESLLGTAEAILHNARKALEDQAVALKQDKAEQERIEERLQRAKGAADREMQALQARLLLAYDKEAALAIEEFETRLSLLNLVKNSFLGLVRRKNAFKDGVEEINKHFAQQLALKAESLAREGARGVVAAIAESMRALLEDMRGGRAASTFSEHSLNVPAIAGRRLEVMDEVIARLDTLLKDNDIEEQLAPQVLRSIGDRTVMGGFLTAVGAVIAGATHIVVFDVTGGIFATLGALLAINTLAFKRGGIIKTFKKSFAQGRERFEEQLAELLPSRTRVIFEDLRQVFAPYFANIIERGQTLNRLVDRRETIERALTQEQARLQELLEKD